MTATEIRDLVVASASEYYDYLTETNRGVQTLGVVSIEYGKEQLIKLLLGGKLLNTETLYFEILTTGTRYSDPEIITYDRDKNILIIRPTPETYSDFEHLNAWDILVGSDLRFLVRRLEEWYWENGSQLMIPTACPDLEAPTDYLPKCKPSEEQKRAIEAIFSNPFTYVWGAPGSGKTQFVLAYAIIHYIRNEKRVVICAPTNNAVEQILRGVLAMIDRTHDINRDKILRLGIPSWDFVRKYPEVCETANLDDKIAKIGHQIQIYKSMLGLDDGLKEEELAALIKTEYANAREEELWTKLAECKRERDELASRTLTSRIKAAAVVACTLDRYITEDLEADHLFLDEVGYASLMKALPLFRQNKPVTFLGDHLQLPPVCEVTELGRNSTYDKLVLWAESAIYAGCMFKSEMTVQSLLENYLRDRHDRIPEMKKMELNTTFRFPANLAALLDKYVYKNGFHSNLDRREMELTCLNAVKDTNDLRRTSLNEVVAIRRYLTENAGRLGSYVILTPYRKQLDLLGKYMPDERKDMNILTVHKSQGREWDTVILSVVDTRDMWFSDSKNRISRGLNVLNTAISRAKKRIVIACDRSYWIAQRGQLLSEIIRTCNLK